ncbi:MAG: hypothetical protein IJ375_06595 [Oscillospiraceae bacterium]|nr:hypothetical protein [Oscillospiraceae bacterium]
MSDCKNCSGGCGGCGGCSGAMELTEGEIGMLRTLAQIPFLPVARRMDDDVPVYLEETDRSPAEYSLILQCLQKRGLIDIDYSQSISGFDYHGYAAYPVRGSFALTARGQQAVEWLEYQGAE